MDKDQRTGRDRSPDTAVASGSRQPDLSERQRRRAEAQAFARRTKTDPREAAMLDEVEAVQADNALP